MQDGGRKTNGIGGITTGGLADQIGIRVLTLAIFGAVVALVVGGGAALATGLGARDYVANLIGAHQFRQAFTIGQTIRLAGFQGRLVAVSTTNVVLDTAEGRVTIPGRIYGESAIIVLPDNE